MLQLRCIRNEYFDFKLQLWLMFLIILLYRLNMVELVWWPLCFPESVLAKSSMQGMETTGEELTVLDFSKVTQFRIL